MDSAASYEGGYEISQKVDRDRGIERTTTIRSPNPYGGLLYLEIKRRGNE